MTSMFLFFFFLFSFFFYSFFSFFFFFQAEDGIRDIGVTGVQTCALPIYYRCGEGNHYGTFSGAISAFSPVAKGKKPHQQEGKNFLTNPPKQGTGYGYLNVTIGAPYKYSSEPYDKAKEIRRVRYVLFVDY